MLLIWVCLWAEYTPCPCLKSTYLFSFLSWRLFNGIIDNFTLITQKTLCVFPGYTKGTSLKIFDTSAIGSYSCSWSIGASITQTHTHQYHFIILHIVSKRTDAPIVRCACASIPLWRSVTPDEIYMQLSGAAALWLANAYRWHRALGDHLFWVPSKLWY